jgi:hypothetical protein
MAINAPTRTVINPCLDDRITTLVPRILSNATAARIV